MCQTYLKATVTVVGQIYYNTASHQPKHIALQLSSFPSCQCLIIFTYELLLQSAFACKYLLVLTYVRHSWSLSIEGS